VEFKRLEYADSFQLLSLPLEVAALGGEDTVLFLCKFAWHGSYNDAAALFLVGGGMF